MAKINIKKILSKYTNVHSLSFHVSIVIFIIIFIAIFMAGFISFNHFQRTTYIQCSEFVRTISRLLAFEVKQSGIPLDTEHSDDLIKAMERIGTLDHSNYAAIYNTDKELVALWQTSGKTYFDPSLNFSKGLIFNRKNAIHLVTPLIVEENGEPIGYFVYGYDKSRLNELNSNAFSMTFWVFLLLAIGSGLILQNICIKLIIEPIRNFSSAVKGVTETGDLTISFENQSNEEFTNLVDAFTTLMKYLRDILNSLKVLSMQLSVIVDDVSIAGQHVNSGALNTQEHTTKTSNAMQVMLKSIYELTDNIGQINKNGEEGASAIYQMTKVNDQVVHNVNTMNSAIAAAKAAVKQNAAGINNVADHIEKLNNDISFTSNSIEIMADTVDAIEETTRATAELSEEVVNNAAAGVEAIQKTTAGIGAIKSSSEMAAQTIGHLGDRINDIGSIIHVIEDITKQTNLLALNAAIIAAQSGENGKSFGVVSEEIAALANRTKSSTREIAELISSIQEESQHAIEAMQEDMGSIEEGVRLGQEAEDILHTIESSANRSTAMVQKIAATTLDQADDIREINNSIGNITRAIKDINTVITQQANDSNTILTNINNINNVSQQVLNSASEQASGTKELSRSINNISRNLSNLNDAQRNQEKEMELMLGDIDTIGNVANDQTNATAKLEETIVSIKEQVVLINQQIRKFKL